MYRLAFPLLLAMGLWLILPQPHSAAQSVPVTWHIESYGDAQFFGPNPEDAAIWHVTCDMPLRSCRARNGSAVLRITEAGPALLFFADADTRITQHYDNMAQDLPELADGPLTPALIAQLSRPGSTLFIERGAQTADAIRLDGIDQVIAYLTWVETAEAQVLRDARGWPGPTATALNEEAVGAGALAAYEEFRRRYEMEHPMLVPETKPQIEFAIQAQGGSAPFVSE